MRQPDRIYTALELLFLASRTAQYAWLKQGDLPMGQDGWARDFCTIRIKGPRRSGHSTAAAKLVRQHLRTVAWISPHPDDHGLTNTKQFIHMKPDHRPDWWGMDLRDVGAVITDCADFLEFREMERDRFTPQNVYERFAPNVQQSIVNRRPFYFIFIQ